MVGNTNARNTTQQAGGAFRKLTRVVNANIGVYTVPINKRARITQINGNLDAVGADATYALAIKRKISGLFEPISEFKAVAIDVKVDLVTLESEDILTDIGDSGSTNGTYDITSTVEEFSN